MAKKIFASLAIIMLSLCCGVCFATENNSNVNLGDQITDSLDKAGDSMRNVADDVMDGMGVRDNNRNNNNNYNSNSRNRNTNNNNYDNNTMDNRTGYTNGNGFTDGYNAVRTSVDEATTGNMSTTTWIWIILAVAAIIITAFVWYYAAQDNDKD